MLGRVNEVVNETSKGWKKFFQKNPNFLTSQEEFEKATSPTILDKSKGKGILGISTPILTQSQPAVTTDTHPQSVVTESVQFISAQTNFEQESVKETGNTVDNTPPTIIDTAPSGEATGAKEVEIDKVKSIESIPASKTDSPTRVLAIDTSQAEKKIVSELSPTELMMMATHKLLKEGTIDKGLIDQSVSVLHRIMLDYQIDDGASPSGKLKALT